MAESFKGGDGGSRPLRLAAGALLLSGIVLQAAAAALSFTAMGEAALALLILGLPAAGVGALLWWLDRVDSRSRAGDRSHHRKRSRSGSRRGDAGASRFTSSMMVSPSEFGPMTRAGRDAALPSSFHQPTPSGPRPGGWPVLPPLPAVTPAPSPPLPSQPGGNALLRGAVATPVVPASATVRPDVEGPAWSAEGLLALPPPRLEALVRALYRQVGFGIRVKPAADGSGQYLWLFSRHHSGPPVSVVHCLSRPGAPLVASSLRALVEAMAAQNVKRGHCVAIGGFSAEAQQYAGRNGLHLMDLPALLRVIVSRTVPQQQALQEAAQPAPIGSDA